jgi:hypothetical protein
MLVFKITDLRRVLNSIWIIKILLLLINEKSKNINFVDTIFYLYKKGNFNNYFFLFYF